MKFEDFEKEIISENFFEELKNYKRKGINCDNIEIKGNFIKTTEAIERIQRINFFLESDIPIVLEGDTGTSKTKSIEVLCDILGISDKLIRLNLSSETSIEDLMGRLISNNENWSGFTFIDGPFVDAYTNGKVLLLDEVNLVQKSIIQCIQSALDSNEICIEISGRKMKKNQRHKDFKIICTQNPNSGSFASKREDLSEFFQRFQIVNFDKFSNKELKDIAIGIAKKNKYSKTNIVKNIGDFHYKWTETKESKKSPQCFTIRDLSSTICSLNKIEPSEAILCFYGSRYEKNEKDFMKKMLLTNEFKNLYKDEIIQELPENFPKCYHSLTIKRAFHYSKIAFENGRHLLITGKQGNGLTQIAKWIAEYYSNQNNNFCFVFNPETTVSDLLGRYIPNSNTDTGNEIIEWKDGPLTNAIKNGLSGVFININTAQSKVIERLNPIIEPKDDENESFMLLQENGNENDNNPI